MAITERDVAMAEDRMTALRDAGHAVAASYHRRSGHLVVDLHTGVKVMVPIRLVEGLTDAAPRAWSRIEISPSGLGLHWPLLDADLYVPALLSGVFGAPDWMALGADRSRDDDRQGAAHRARP